MACAAVLPRIQMAATTNARYVLPSATSILITVQLGGTYRNNDSQGPLRVINSFVHFFFFHFYFCSFVFVQLSDKHRRYDTTVWYAVINIIVSEGDKRCSSFRYLTDRKRDRLKVKYVLTAFCMVTASEIRFRVAGMEVLSNRSEFLCIHPELDCRLLKMKINKRQR